MTLWVLLMWLLHCVVYLFLLPISLLLVLLMRAACCLLLVIFVHTESKWAYIKKEKKKKTTDNDETSSWISHQPTYDVFLRIQFSLALNGRIIIYTIHMPTCHHCKDEKGNKHLCGIHRLHEASNAKNELSDWKFWYYEARPLALALIHYKIEEPQRPDISSVRSNLCLQMNPGQI